jgi:hypothetical protein
VMRYAWPSSTIRVLMPVMSQIGAAAFDGISAKRDVARRRLIGWSLAISARRAWLSSSDTHAKLEPVARRGSNVC